MKQGIKDYAEKYGMSYEEFDGKIRDKSLSGRLEKNRGVIELENDYFDWGGLVTEVEYFREGLKELTIEG
ncbi:MAG: hypothetical protein DDT33_01275 [Firmicutes bacterium]|nr:hypothetical protein [Bacillota bacterium]